MSDSDTQKELDKTNQEMERRYLDVCRTAMMNAPQTIPCPKCHGIAELSDFISRDVSAVYVCAHDGERIVKRLVW